jgi:hypothetical protein
VLLLKRKTAAETPPPRAGAVPLQKENPRRKTILTGFYHIRPDGKT